MNTEQLECFVSLARTLNYRKTADTVGLTQPAVSKQIQSLEKELNTLLFHRTTRSVSLTSAGLYFFKEAEEMLKTYYRSRSGITRFSEEEGTLRIGYMHPYILKTASEILNSIPSAVSVITPSFVQGQTDENLQRLSDRELDVILSIKDASFEDDAVLFHKLYTERFACVMRSDHELAETLKAEGKTAVTSADVFPYPQIISIPRYIMKRQFSPSRSIVPVNTDVPAALCYELQEVQCLLKAGYGYAFLPAHAVPEDPSLAVFEWKESPVTAAGIYYRKDAYYSPSSRVSFFLKASDQITMEKTD